MKTLAYTALPELILIMLHQSYMICIKVTDCNQRKRALSQTLYDLYL
ncbi:hypothetical protein T06_14361 [Trichinella sp. T6]|nr:hypothetical protein T06_14361 [Trichinella sp. T6]